MHTENSHKLGNHQASALGIVERLKVFNLSPAIVGHSDIKRSISKNHVIEACNQLKNLEKEGIFNGTQAFIL